MACCSVNDRAVAHARQLIKGRQYVLDSAFLDSHGWDDDKTTA
jgi:hypothetical protein